MDKAEKEYYGLLVAWFRYNFLLLLFCGAMALSSAPLWAASGVTSDVTLLAFRDQAEGTVSSPQTVTLTNSQAGDGIIGSIAVVGQDPQQFLISQDLCSGTVLASGESCSVMVLYSPAAEFFDGVGTDQAELSVEFADASHLLITVTGNSLVPQIQSNVSSLQFGDQVEGQQSDPQKVILTNLGAVDLVLKNSKFIGGNTADFGLSLDFCTFQILAPGESCQMEIEMRPTDVGDRSAQLAIETNDPTALVFTINLAGNGTGSGGCALGPANFRWGMAAWFLPPALAWFCLRSRKTRSRRLLLH